jgi:hypothetical protein
VEVANRCSQLVQRSCFAASPLSRADVIHDGHISTSVRVDGPEPGDLVVVTVQAALRQIVDHHMTTGQAEGLGLIRFYGDASKLALLRKIFENRESEM